MTHERSTPRSRATGIRLACLAVLALACAACGADRSEAPATAGPRHGPFAPTEGSLEVPGLTAPVRVVRDRWGIPHIYAASQDDLFLAQGFVQAQDRLFQIDLWRRSTRGRLAEVLGPDFVARDRMSRLVRFRGDMDEEWASYAPDTRRIVEQFVLGVNAWVAVARADPPEEFRMAGYLPEPWAAEDLLNRAEAFRMSGNALDEVFRSRVAAAAGLDVSTRLMPPDPPVTIEAPAGVDLTLVNDRLSDALRGIAAPAVFPPGSVRNAQAAAPADPEAAGSNNWVVTGARSATGHPLLANDPHRNLDHPSLRYLVHLKAPGWNVIGAVVPWFPGVAIGHNERIGWGLTIFRADVQDLYVEKVNPANPRQYEWRGAWVDMEIERDTIPVKGRDRPVEVEHRYTRHGPVVAVDTERHLAFALRWTGTEPGTAGYLAGLSLDRASNWSEFRQALARWKMPGENFVYADVDGTIGYQVAALVPVRPNWTGLLPVPGWAGEYEWTGWHDPDDLPHDANPSAGYLATANNNMLPAGYPHRVGYSWSHPARINRIRDVMDGQRVFGVEDFQRLQHDAHAWTADRLVPLVEGLRFEDPSAERGRVMLVEWDRKVVKDSAAAALFVAWERRLGELLVAGRLDRHLAAEFLPRAAPLVVPVVTRPSAEWFDGTPAATRDRVLEEALASVVADLEARLGPDAASWTWGRLHTATFRHVLSVGDETASRFDVGPFPRDGYGLTVLATSGAEFTQTDGASFREILDVADWDRSVGTTAAGQSGQPGSPHFDDLARLWADHAYFPLSFSDEAVERHAEATLTLTPAR